MRNIFLKIKEQLAAQLPFAVYSKPGSEAITGVFQKDDAQYSPDDFKKKGFVFAPFEGEAVFIPFDAAEVVNAEIEVGGFKKLQPKSFDINKEAKADFEALVAKSVAAINTGQFKKLVTSRTEAVEFDDADVTLIYEKLLYTYPAAFRYCFYSPQSGLWMGATPEQLLKVENNTVHTVALAGTQLFTEEQETVWETKEQEEQQFVTDYILKELREHAADIVTTEPYTFRAGNIVHIKTDISAELKMDSSIKDVISTLHPTPAVCGLPKADAKAFLIHNEGYDRGFYSGYLGELNADAATGHHKTDLFVNLRCMKIEGNIANLYIGCGITKDSNPEKEFFETVNKSMTMRKVL
ncbi:isochorismate synthase [Flavobacterium rivuli WB 3.3-2 = DSM 21788]|uniref:isochorismate synthase n=1 Tax=Flavobacterium rivuli WB 3.3-2 = DSM 21788 TaxID=1121895 RepID=A0A0A2MAX5_9FLAO|nr:isochorismate synthase [Flavobacterium rivuli]KGO85440.1 isochorismate synthase [Flavobacterium rivuli WB 3.3-2 = DSM 21788]